MQARFYSNPKILIHQLSNDLWSKKTDVVLLRNVIFQREQELYRLRAEYVISLRWIPISGLSNSNSKGCLLGCFRVENTISTSKMSKSIDTLKHLAGLHDAESEGHARKWDKFMRGIKKEVFKRNATDYNQEVFGMKAFNVKDAHPGLTNFFVSTEVETNDESR